MLTMTRNEGQSDLPSCLPHQPNFFDPQFSGKVFHLKFLLTSVSLPIGYTLKITQETLRFWLGESSDILRDFWVLFQMQKLIYVNIFEIMLMDLLKMRTLKRMTKNEKECRPLQQIQMTCEVWTWLQLFWDDGRNFEKWQSIKDEGRKSQKQGKMRNGLEFQQEFKLLLSSSWKSACSYMDRDEMDEI